MPARVSEGQVKILTDDCTTAALRALKLGAALLYSLYRVRLKLGGKSWGVR